MLPKLSGPSRPPASGGKPKQLVILLHGLGADGSDLIGLAPYWAQLLPEAEFVSPNAPFPCDMGPFGHQWFSVQDRAPATVLAGVRAAAPILDAFIDDLLTERGLASGSLAIVGFSQGTMMSLFVALRRPQPQLSLHALVKIADRNAGHATSYDIIAINLINDAGQDKPAGVGGAIRRFRRYVIPYDGEVYRRDRHCC